MANERFKRTPTSTGNRSIHTWSGWIKRNVLGDWTRLFSTAGQTLLQLTGSSPPDQIRYLDQTGSNYDLRSTSLFRDTGNWMHIVLSVDHTLSVPRDRVRIYVNGAELDNYSTDSTSNGAQNLQTYFNSITEHGLLGRETVNAGENFKGEAFDIFWVDGQALTPDVFGFYKDGDGYQSSGTTQATDFRPGQWMPHSPAKIKKDVNRSGGFGVNGFYLPMNDSSNPGADFHCAPNSIIKLKGEDLPQPQNGAPTTSDAYVSQLRTDPYAANLVYALPLISGGKNSGFGDYSNDIKGSGTAKTVSAVTYNSITPTITSGHSAYGSFVDYNSPAGTGGYIDVADSTAFDNVNLTTAEWTFEGWYKRGALNNGSNLIQFGNATDYQGFSVNLHTSGRLWYIWSYNGSSWGVLDSTGGPVIPQDEWCHIAIVKEATPTSKIVTYVNGVAAKSVEVTGNISYTSPNYMRIGGHYRGPGSGGDTYYYDGGIFDARFYSIVKYKGGFDVPKPYAPVGIEAFRTTADTCKNNFATWNAIDRGSLTLSDGNLSIENSGSYRATRATIGIPTTGKWYYEHRESTVRKSNVIGSVGIAMNNHTLDGNAFGTSFSGFYWGSAGLQIAINGTNAGTNWVSSPGIGDGDILNIAYDADSRNIWFGINGTYYTVSGVTLNGNGNPTSGTNPTGTVSTTYSNLGIFPYCNAYNTISQTNFGQNPSFSGTVTAGTNTDGNGKGLFKYAPPTGFLSLCEDNLPTPAIADPGKHFKCVLYTGSSNNSQSIGKVGFQPDLVWVKKRGTAGDHKLIDSVRGSGLVLESNTTDIEGNENNNFTGFNSDGFDLGANNAGAWNESPHGYVAWCWKAGGAAVSNTDGSITSQVSANQTAGFSIVSYTGTGANATVGHGLNKTPKFIITKQRTTASHHWRTYHSSIGATRSVYLDLTNAQSGVDAGFMNSTEPTTSVFSIGTDTNINENTQAHIAYCWTEIEGFSKFGSYVGNSSNDGTFVYCGFKPAWVMIKVITTGTTNSWYIHDSSRNSTNPSLEYLTANSSTGGTVATSPLDMLSNGFKLRNGSYDGYNGNYTYIFMAFAESPFQTANAK